MRKVEFNELRQKNMYDEEDFYQYYLENSQRELSEKVFFNEPTKQYEIFYLNILGGKIILLNKDYIKKKDTANQELYYNYKIATEVYNCLLDIYDGIESEKNESNELYKEERLKIDAKINKLRQQDNAIFSEALLEYNIIKNSKIYNEYINLKKENQNLKEQNKELTKRVAIFEKRNISIIEKILNKFKKIKKISDGEK